MALTSVILALIGFILPRLFFCVSSIISLQISYSWKLYETLQETCFILSLILYIVAIILGAISLAKAKKHGKAIDIPLVGLILGILFLFSSCGELYSIF